MTRCRWDESGSGVISTTFGVGTFLVMLIFASHVLLNVWVISSVDSVAHDAVTDVATSGASYDTRAAVEARAATRARPALGEYGGDVDFEFRSTPQEVVLVVTAPELALLPPHLAKAVGLDGFTRTLVVRWEPLA